jgi:hypothetical protein
MERNGTPETEITKRQSRTEQYMSISTLGRRAGGVVAVAVVALVAVAGCSSDKDETATAAKPASPSAPASSAAASAPAVAGGPVLTAAQLTAIKLPKPKFGPAAGQWKDPIAPADGQRRTEFVVGDDVYVAVLFDDCNQAEAQQYASKAVFSRDVFDACFASAAGGDQPSGATAGGAPVWKINEQSRYLRIGHLGIRVAYGDKASATATGADLETFIKSLDLAALAKL